MVSGGVFHSRARALSFSPKKRLKKIEHVFLDTKRCLFGFFWGLEASGIISLAGIIRYNHPKIGTSSVNDGISIAMFACRVAMDHGDDLSKLRIFQMASRIWGFPVLNHTQTPNEVINW